MDKTAWRIVYMGTPDFAVAPLKALVDGGYSVVAVVTMPDKPAGRGMKLQASPVKRFALEHNLPVLQPEKLRDEAFLEALKSYKPDLQIVVAFRMLPEVVWALPPQGTFNLHASLLPQYRGAAPIHHAVMNGETETGVTTFFLQHDIDTGDMLLQEKIGIDPDENTGSVHDRLMSLGADVVCKTVDGLLARAITPQPQSGTFMRPAPKLFRENTRIDWSRPVSELHNFIRGLCPFPSAWTELKEADGQVVGVKVFEARAEHKTHGLEPGTILVEDKSDIKVAAGDGFVHLMRFQLAGRKPLQAKEFLLGYPEICRCRFV